MFLVSFRNLYQIIKMADGWGGCSTDGLLLCLISMESWFLKTNFINWFLLHLLSWTKILIVSLFQIDEVIIGYKKNRLKVKLYRPEISPVNVALIFCHSNQNIIFMIIPLWSLLVKDERIPCLGENFQIQIY